ncbi:MAG: amidohydrolase family protein [Chloroflexi bacterium]|nr:amidohydrolase family protein [Chloroflexota bacterium]MBU1747329.1 amidohydrolase family protein [Chloroflexota bacterium]
MDELPFADIPVIDGHIHLPHPELIDGVLEVMRRTGTARANLVGVPDLQVINQNPALIAAKARCPDRFTICGALDYTPVLARSPDAPAALGRQVHALRAIGFDGLKLIEGKPMVRQILGIPLDSPVYAGMWAALEELDLPVVWHVADPEEFWDPVDCPDWARAAGWFYGDGTFPPKEALYAEVDHVLARHPGLKVIFAHFYFLSADLDRAGAFLDAHPTVCFDLTPGIEIYHNFARQPVATRDFFIRYQDRLVYGTDIGAANLLQPAAVPLDLTESTGRATLVRRFLEVEGRFDAPAGVGHGLGLDGGGYCGIALPRPVLDKMYRANFQRLFGPAPAPLNRDAALAELERLATAIGGAGDNPARRVADWLQSAII